MADDPSLQRLLEQYKISPSGMQQVHRADWIHDPQDRIAIVQMVDDLLGWTIDVTNRIQHFKHRVFAPARTPLIKFQRLTAVLTKNGLSGVGISQFLHGLPLTRPSDRAALLALLIHVSPRIATPTPVIELPNPYRGGGRPRRRGAG